MLSTWHRADGVINGTNELQYRAEDDLATIWSK
jgi:hypothetical protein